MGLSLTADTRVPSGCEFDLSCYGVAMRLVDRHNHHLGKADLLVDFLTENEDRLLISLLLFISCTHQIHPHLKAMFDNIGS